MSVHGPEPDLVLAVRLQLSEEHAVAVGGAAEGGRVRDERQVVPGGGAQVRGHGAQALKHEQVSTKVRVISSILLSNFNFVRLHEDYISNAQLCP